MMEGSLKHTGYLVVAVVAVVSAAAGALSNHYLAKPPSLSGLDARYEQVKHLSAHEVATRVLPGLSQQLAGNVVAVSFAGSTLPHETPEDMLVDSVDFRLRAKGAGWRGLCVADNLSIDLGPVARQGGHAAMEPTGSFRMRKSYRVVSEATNDVAWSEAYEAELDRMCASLGPEALFFSIDEGVDLRTVTDMLPALRDATDSVAVDCTGNLKACASPRDVLSGLAPGLLVSVRRLADCEEGRSCLELAFSNGRGSPPAVWIARAKGAYRGTYQTGWGKLVLSDLKLSQDGAI